MPGSKVTMEDVKHGLRQQPKATIFPGYNGNDEDFVIVSPKPGECAQRVEVSYNTNFVVSASDASTLTELIDIAKGLLPIASSPPSVNTIINGVEMTNAGINKAVDTERASGSQEFQVNPSPCPPPTPQCFTVTLQVFGSALITDADPRDDDEAVELNLTLAALGAMGHRKFEHDKKSDTIKTVACEVSIGPRRADGPFSVYAKLDESCKTDGPGFGGGDSVSMIKIDMVKIIIEATPCPEEQPKTPPAEKPGAHDEHPRKAGR